MELHLKLHQKQGLALLSKATEILYGGAAGGGKSHLMRVFAIVWCCLIPGLQVYIFRKHFPDLIKNHWEGPTSFPALLANWVEYEIVQTKYSPITISFKNGSKIFFCHCQHEKDRFKYQGAEIHLLMIDELTLLTEKVYRFLRGRCRVASLPIPDEYKDLFPRILCGSNPGNIGHGWVKATFIDEAQPMEIRRMSKKEGGMLRQYIPALMSDNPSLEKDYEDKLEGLDDPALVEAMKRGNWDIVAGGMFDDVWKRERHVIAPFKIPKSWYIDRSYDWGGSSPFVVLWWAESDGTTAPNGITYPRGTVFLIYEWYGWNGTPNQGLNLLSKEIAQGIIERETDGLLKDLVGENIIHPGPADTQIYNADPVVGISIADDMEAAGVEWTEADKAPGSRRGGWQRMRSFMKAATKFPMEEPALFIFEHCHQWIRTVPILTRDEKDRDDVDDQCEDHCGDATRYRLGYNRNDVRPVPLPQINNESLWTV